MATCETISTLLEGPSVELDGKVLGKTLYRFEVSDFSSRESLDKNSPNRESSFNLVSGGEEPATPSRRRMSMMDRMAAPIARIRNSQAISKHLHRYRDSVSRITHRVVQADRTWVGCMMASNTIDVVLNLTNFVFMSNENLNFGLVIGPPSTELWYVLLVFTILSWLLYMPETVNTISVLFSPSREPFVPIPYELTATLLLKHIPLSAVVYFVGRCRREFTTLLESACNAFRIIHILMRLVWHAHMEGRKLKKNPRHPTGKMFVLLSCLLFGISTSFAIKNWRNEPGRALKRYHLINVSIVMFDENSINIKPFPPERLFFKLEINDLVKNQGYSLEQPWLVRSILPIKERGSLTADYDCTRRSPSDQRPPECSMGVHHLRFKFIFQPATVEFPYGVISYGYARLLTRGNDTEHLQDTATNSSDEVHSKAACVQSTGNLRGRWKMYFLEIKRYYYNFNTVVIASAPFRKSWTHPRPMFNDAVVVCVNGTPVSEPLEYQWQKPYTRKSTVYIPL